MNHESLGAARPYLTFKLGNEYFAADVAQVLEILEVPKLTKVPHSPVYMRGVINLRGSVLPIIDARLKFGLPAVEDSVSTCIMVITIQLAGEELKIGVIADSVQEVLEIGTDQLQPAPSLGSKYKAQFIEGMVKMQEQFIMLLNLDQIFSCEELILVQETSPASSL